MTPGSDAEHRAKIERARQAGIHDLAAKIAARDQDAIEALRECPSCMIDRHDLCSGDCDCPHHSRPPEGET